jgi:signal transduction histidine kinase
MLKALGLARFWKKWFLSWTLAAVTAFAVFLVVLVSWVQLIIGPDVVFSFFYVVPIAFAAWFGGTRLGSSIAILSAAAWLGTDLAARAGYSHWVIPYWNCLVRLGIFLLVAWQLAAIRRLTQSLEAAAQETNAMLVREMETRKQLQGELLHTITKQEEQAAHDLHDGLCPLLGGIALKAKLLQENLSGAGLPGAEGAGEIVALLKEANERAHRLAKGLDPVVVELDGLTAALERLVKDKEKLFSVSCLFKTDLAKAPVSPGVALQLYHIAQEAIHNAVKHSGAQCIEVELLSAGPGLRLIIADDGEGFKASAETAGGMGLRTLQTRAESIGATLRIDSQLGQGTRVECSLPLPVGGSAQQSGGC